MDEQNDANPIERKRRIRKILIGTGLGLLVLVLIGVNVYRISQKDVVRVDTAQVSRKQLVEKVPASGKVIAEDKEVLFSEASGMVKTLKAKLGDQVKAGQILVELYVPNAQKNLADAEAAFSRAQSDLARARSGGRSPELAEAENAFKQAEISYLSYEEALKRAQLLYEQGAMSRVDLEKARDDFAKGEALYNKNLADLNRAREAFPLYLQSLESALEAARIHLDSARRQALGQGLVCPRDGQVLSINVNPGDIVNERAPLLSISSLGQISIQADIPEGEAAKIKMGQKVKVSGLGLADKRCQGKVVQVGLELLNKIKKDKNEDTYLPVVVELDEARTLLPGSNVDLEITTAEEDALVVPIEALVEKDEVKQVWAVRDGLARLVEVATGISDGLTIQIKTGLNADDRVVLNPPGDLRDGKKVRGK